MLSQKTEASPNYSQHYSQFKTLVFDPMPLSR